MRGLPLVPVLLAGAFLLLLMAPSGQATVSQHQPGEPPVAWVVPFPRSAPAGDYGDSMYVVASDTAGGSPSLRSYDPNGALRWSTALAGTSFSDVGYNGATVTVRDNTGSVRGFDPKTGGLVWQNDVGTVAAEFLDAAPVGLGRIFVWAPSAGSLRVRALDAASGVTQWDSALSWAPSTILPVIASTSYGVFVTSRTSDGSMWQLQQPDGSLVRSWNLSGYLTSPPESDFSGGSTILVALVKQGQGATPTEWRIEKRSADTGAKVWDSTFTESSSPVCCDLVVAPASSNGRIIVVTPNAYVRLSTDDGHLLGQTAAQGQVWSRSLWPGFVIRGPSGALPARFESYSDIGDRNYALALDLAAMPSGGAFLGYYGGGVRMIQGLPQRLLDTVPTGALTMISWVNGGVPSWDVAADMPTLTYDAASQRLKFAAYKSYNPLGIHVERQAVDGAWEYATTILDPDFGGDGLRSWTVAGSGTYRGRVDDWVAQSSGWSNTVTATLPAPTSSGSSSTTTTSSATSTTSAMPTASSTGSSSSTMTSSATFSCSPGQYDPNTNSCGASGGGGGGGGSTSTGSPTITYTQAPPPPPSFSATATYTSEGSGGGSASGRTFEAKPGRLVIDSPSQGGTLSGAAVLRGRMVDPELLGAAITVTGVATWGAERWPFDQAIVAPDGSWQLTWDTDASPDGRHLLIDGGYRIAVEGAGSSVESAYTLANGQWMKATAANVTFEGPEGGAVWVNVTWQGTAGFRPGLVWIAVTGTQSPVRQPVPVQTTDAGNGTYRFTLTTALQVQPAEHLPLDVLLEAEKEGTSGIVSLELARRPATGVIVASRTSGDVAWAGPAAAGVAVSGFAAALVASTEAGRFWLLRLAPIGLFSRIQGEETKTHRRREQLLLLVEARPGISFRELGREAGIRGGVLTHHVMTLEREGLLRRQRVGTRLYFHPSGPVPPPVRQMPALQASLLRLVQRTPGMSQSEAARKLGVTRQALQYHIARLRSAGLLEGTPAGRETILGMATGARARLWVCPTCRSLLEGPKGPAVRCPTCGAQAAANSAAAG